MNSSAESVPSLSSCTRMQNGSCHGSAAKSPRKKRRPYTRSPGSSKPQNPAPDKWEGTKSGRGGCAWVLLLCCVFDQGVLSHGTDVVSEEPGGEGDRAAAHLDAAPALGGDVKKFRPC